MPTGYTAGVSDGSITTLKQYALTCARAMGACISMRDDPLDTEIPDKFEPSSYNAEKLKEAEEELDRLQNLSILEIEKEHSEEYDRNLKYYYNLIKKLELIRIRYESMLDKVYNWHTGANGIKEFMISQLKESLEFDVYQPEAPKITTSEQWWMDKIEQVSLNILYHAKENAAEIKRAEGRTKWMKALRKSLENTSE